MLSEIGGLRALTGSCGDGTCGLVSQTQTPVGMAHVVLFPTAEIPVGMAHVVLFPRLRLL